MIMSYHQTAMVNTFCHIKSCGYRNYETGDNSRNIGWMSFLTFGLSLHNNHHMFPAKANFAVKSGEIDIGYKLSKLFNIKERT